MRLTSSPADIAVAAKVLNAGGIVAIPTETVYGLAADATNESAVRRIFEAKGRPSNNPIIVHVPDATDARRWTTGWDERAERLASTFWPGPLTLVLPASPLIAPSVLAGGNTVGLRAPNHPTALELLRKCGLPLAAPSANRSNRLSPTTADAVLDTLEGHIDAVLDGGPCQVGIESTVLDLSDAAPRILRPGMISAAEIAAVIGAFTDRDAGSEDAILRSPGLMPRHYAPTIPLLIVETLPLDDTEAYLIDFGDTPFADDRRATLPKYPISCARVIYDTLRRAEKSGARRIVLQHPPIAPEWEPLLDRLRRAAHGT